MTAHALHKVPGALGAGYRAAPLAEEMDWQLKGACQDMTWVFFPEQRSNSLAVEEAKRICKHSCPVLQECRQWALSHREEHGVWGGLSERERVRIWKGEKSA